MAPRYSCETGTTAQSPSWCSDVLPPSRMSSANNVLAEGPSLRPSSCRRARRRDPGKAKGSTFPGPSSCLQESPTQFSIRSNHGKTSKRCIWLHVVPIRMSPWMTDDDPLTKIHNAIALSTNKATENSGNGPGSSRARPKDQPFDPLNSSPCAHGWCHSICEYTRGPCLKGATESMQLLHRNCR